LAIVQLQHRAKLLYDLVILIAKRPHQELAHGFLPNFMAR
jgi:hypothetical protein